MMQLAEEVSYPALMANRRVMSSLTTPLATQSSKTPPVAAVPNAPPAQPNPVSPGAVPDMVPRAKRAVGTGWHQYLSNGQLESHATFHNLPGINAKPAGDTMVAAI